MTDLEKVLKGLKLCSIDTEYWSEPCDICPYGKGDQDCVKSLMWDAVKVLNELHQDKMALEVKVASKGSEDAKLDEWCDQCNEYDQQKHCCPRFNHVIRNTVDELKKQEQWNYVKDGLPTTDDWLEVAILDEHGDTPFTYTSFGWYLEMAKVWIVDNDYRTDIYAWKPLSRAPEVVKGE